MPSVGSGNYPMQLGKYRVLGHIATGGMGAVYKAVAADSGQEVALKVLSPEIAARPQMRERLRREAVHGAKFNHENIVDFLEFGEHEGMYYLAMEYVHGKNLQEYIDRHGALAPELAEYLLRQIAAALDHVHQLGFIHRDIKPSNILLTRKDGKPLAKLADLGLIRGTTDEDFRLTREGHTVGTVDYLAPEQARDSSLADIRSDLYSLGCTFYHMLTGSAPFADGNLVERLYKHANIDAADVRLVNPRIPAKLAAVCRRMLAKSQNDRYQTPAELLAELRGDEAANEAALNAAESSEAIAVAKEKAKAASRTPAQRAASGEFAMAQAALDSGDWKTAIPLFQASCRLDPNQIAYRKALREALQNAPRPAWHWLIVVYHRLRFTAAKRLGKPAQVLEFGEFVLAAQPNDLKVHLMLAEAALTCRFNDLGHWMLEQATHVHGGHPQLHRALALHWERMGDVKQAISYWEMVARADPDHAEARFHLNSLSARDTMQRGHYQDNIDTGLLDSKHG